MTTSPDDDSREGRRYSPRRHAVAVVLLVAAVGCGGDDSDSADGAATSDPGASEPAASEPAATDPATTVADQVPATEAPSNEDLGDEIAALAISSVEEVVAALEDRPEPAEATTRLTAIKERTIEQMVALGHQREALDEAGRSAVDSSALGAIGRFPAQTFADYQAALDHYAEQQELRELIASFNIISQYANFELLRTQEPDEATRLGLG